MESLVQPRRMEACRRASVAVPVCSGTEGRWWRPRLLQGLLQASPSVEIVASGQYPRIWMPFSTGSIHPSGMRMSPMDEAPSPMWDQAPSSDLGSMDRMNSGFWTSWSLAVKLAPATYTDFICFVGRSSDVLLTHWHLTFLTLFDSSNPH